MVHRGCRHRLLKRCEGAARRTERVAASVWRSERGAAWDIAPPSTAGWRPLGERHSNPYADIGTANLDFVEAEKLLKPGTDLNEVVFRVRRRLYGLWDEVHRLAEALDRQGELVGADLIRSVARMPSWL